MIHDNDPHLKGKIIEVLYKSCIPAIYNVSIDWQDNFDSLSFDVPRPGVNYITYENEPFNAYAILKKSDGEEILKDEE